MVLKLLGKNIHQAAPRLTLLPLSKASTECITFIRILHHTLLSALIAHLYIGVLYKLRSIRDTLTSIPCLPHDGVDDRMAMLSK
jgi:hypothetical protein